MKPTSYNTRNNDSRSLQPIAILIDELKSEDIRRRINSVKNLGTIANVLGPERTRVELVPFIMELIDDEDEVLDALSDQLLNFINYVGGPQFAQVLIQPLEQMCFVEESTIRDKSVNALKKILSSIDIPKNQDIIYNLIKHLCSGDYHSAKAAASSLIPFLYPNMSAQAQNEFIKMYRAMVESDVPSVRKNAAINLKNFIILIPKAPQNDLISIINQLIQDNQDFVRLFLIDSIIALAQTLPIQKYGSIVYTFLKAVAEDPSWRIRYVVCDKINDIAAAIGKDQTVKVLLPYYIGFLQQNEPELKNVACLKLVQFCENLEMDTIVNKILPLLKPLSLDKESYVRASLASSILGISPLVGKKYTNDYIMEIFMNLLKDQSPDVRLNIFKKLDDFTEVMGSEILYQSLIPSLTELAVDKNWRIRLSTIEYLIFFARAIGENFLTDKLSKILVDWLGDKVYAVREAAVECVKNLAKTLGGQWAEKNLVQKLFVFQNNPNYLYRMTTLFAVQAIAEQLSPDYIAKNVLPQICLMSKDKVPNVRMNVAKTLKVLLERTKDKKPLDQGKQTLQLLLGDSDSDVKYIAKTVLDTLQLS